MSNDEEGKLVSAAPMRGIPKRELWGKYDMKELEFLHTLAGMIRTREYDESTVAQLVLFLRRWADPDGILWEFAGFVAHRARDRGHFHAELHSRWTRATADPSTFEDHDFSLSPPKYTPDEIGEELNKTLLSLRIEPIPASEFDDFTLCLMSLLQHAAFLDKKTKEPFAILRMLHIDNSVHLVALLESPDNPRTIWFTPVFRIGERPMPWSTARTLRANEDSTTLSMPTYVGRLIREDGELRGYEVDSHPPKPAIDPRP